MINVAASIQTIHCILYLDDPQYYDYLPYLSIYKLSIPLFPSRHKNETKKLSNNYSIP